MKYVTPTIETERLLLKRGNFNDFLQVYEYDFRKLKNVDGVFEFIKNDPNKLKIYDSFDQDEEDTLDFLVYLKDNNVPIANIVYDRYREDYNSLELAVNQHPSYWGNGYMMEAIVASMDYVFNTLNFDNIIYSFAEENYRSLNLNKKLGFDFLSENYYRSDVTGNNIRIIQTILSREKYNALFSKNIIIVK